MISQAPRVTARNAVQGPTPRTVLQVVPLVELESTLFQVLLTVLVVLLVSTKEAKVQLLVTTVPLDPSPLM